MKTYFQFILIAASLIFCSWTAFKPNLSNSNSWSISIGKKILLASWKNNKMGDTVIIDIKTLKSKDTLFVTQYLCGYDGRNSSTTLTIKDDRGQVIKESTSMNSQLMYSAKLSLTEIMASNKFTNNQILNIYFSIYSKSDKINQTVLLGRLQVK
jgi:hypothetical protein